MKTLTSKCGLFRAVTDDSGHRVSFQQRASNKAGSTWANCKREHSVTYPTKCLAGLRAWQFKTHCTFRVIKLSDITLESTIGQVKETSWWQELVALFNNKKGVRA